MSSPGYAGDAAPQSGRGRVLAGLMLTMGLAAMDATIVATAIPSITHDLGGFSLFAWVFSVYLLAQAVTVPIYGRLADVHGRKPVLVIGMLIFLAGSAASGAAWSMIALIAFRGLQGIGAGAIQSTVTTLAGDLYTVQERGRIQGYLSSVWGVAAVVGPAIGGFFAEYGSWRWIFYVNLPIGAAALWVIVHYLHERPAPGRRHRLDLPGAALLVAGAGLLIFGLLQGGIAWPWLSGPSVAVFAVAAASLVGFGVRERRAREPLVPPWVFGRRLLIGANLAAAVVGLLVIGLTTFLPTYAQGVLGASAVVAGFALAAMSIGWPTASTLSARLYLRIGFRDTALIGALLCLAAGLIFATLPRHASIGQAVIGSFVMGAGLGLLSTPVIVGIQSVVRWNRRGVVTSANMFGRQLGQAVGAAIFGAIANSALVGWFGHAPAAFAGVLPHSVNAASNVLGKGSHLPHAAEAYVRAGLFHATHHVFLALTVVAAAGIVVLLATPRRFTPPYDEPADADEAMADAASPTSEATEPGSAVAR